MATFSLGILVLTVLCSSVTCNSISGINLLEKTVPECSGPTTCNVKSGKTYTLTFNYRIDMDFSSENMKWQAVVGKPKGAFSSYKDDQILFKDYHLCREKGDGLVLQKEACKATNLNKSSTAYKVTVPAVKMPDSPVTEKFYLMNGEDTPGTLGLIVKQ